ncbi:putative HEAT repeat protein (DRIM) [Penicillium brasilianum]|uniref:Putative HEAT repeat protein (DRIM) n=1 Tax=Penicillium brasilianum TaxID=104259 RepID=A0A1S9RFX9_PENBI|nr:putative HEAT repeat protein (DRIM) [Penicillium brasilianum]
MVAQGSRAKPTRRLKGGTETTKTHRFEGFSQRIAKLKIDPIHRVRRASFGEDDGETTSYFRSALDHWVDMNLSDNFTQFTRRVNALSESLAQIVYHEEKIMGLLVEFIEKRDQNSLEPLLSLLAQFARDLGVRFEKHFATSVTLVASVAATHPDVEVVEWSFTCLAWIFKFLSRLLVPDLRQLLKIMTPYLGKERQKPFVARFAAESMSFLIRKAGLFYYKNKTPLENAVSFLFEDITQTAEDGKSIDSYKEGLMVMFADAIKGVNHGLHSNGVDVLRCVLDQVPSTTANNRVPAEVAGGVVINLIHHTTPDTFGPVIDTVREYIDIRSKEGQNPNFPQCCRLIFVCVATRKASRIRDWKAVHQTLVSLLKQAAASPDDHSEAIPQLLGAVAYALQLSPMDEMLPFMRSFMDLVSTGPLSKYFLFFCTTFSEWGSERFQSLLVPYFQKFINSSWKEHEFEMCLALLKLHETGCITPEVSRPGYVSCPDGLKSRIYDSLVYPAKDQSILNALVKLPKAISLFADPTTLSKIVKKLHENILSAMEDAASDTDSEKIDGFTFYLGQGFKTYVELAKEAGELDSSLWQPILAASTKFSRLPLFLEGVLAFMCAVQRQESEPETASVDEFASNLILNLAGPSHRLRFVSLQILQQLIVQYAKEDHSAVALAIEVEESPLTLQSARTIQMHVRKLALLYPQIASHKWMATLIPYFCFGLFSKKLAPLWDDSAAALKIISENPEGEKIVSDLSIQWLQERDSGAVGDEQPEDEKDSNFVASDYECFNVNNIERTVGTSWTVAQAPSITLSEQFDKEHKIADLVPALPRSHALQVLNAAPNVAEKRSRQIVPLFLSWALRDDQDDAPANDATIEANNSEAPIRWGFKDRLAMLALFGQFLNPRVLYRAPEVHEAVMGLLCHGNSEIQKAALKALFTWKNAHVVPYQENLLNILDESRFKDELMVFVRVGGEDSLIEQEHRSVLMPVLLRLLYGRMISKAGASSTQAGQSGRRKAILRTLSHLSEDDFRLFINISFGPLAEVAITGDAETDEKAFLEELTSPRRQLGLLKMIDTVFDTLQSRMTAYTTQAMNVIIYCLVRACRSLYDEKSALYVDRQDERSLSIFQNIRQSCIRCLSLVFSVSSDQDWTPYVRIIFRELIDDRLEQFPIETAQGVSGLLRLFHTWASAPRSTFYLVNHNKEVLTKVIDILAVESARDEVKIFVLDEVLVPLVKLASGIKLKDDGEDEDETMPDFPPEQIRSEVLSPFLEHALSHLGRLLRRGPSKPVLFSGVTALSLTAPCVESSGETSSLISIATYLLRQPPDRVNPKTKSGLLRILEHFLPLYSPKDDAELSQQVFEAVSSTFDYFKDDANREVLARVFTAFASHDQQLGEVAELCADLNSRSAKRLGPDYERRLQAFRKINDELSQSLNAKQWRPLLFNMLFHVKDEDELAIRSSAAFGLKRFIEKAASEAGDQGFEALVNDVLISSLKYGIRQKSELIRSEIVAVLGYFIKLNPTRPSVQDMHVLLVGDDDEASFFNNILHVQQHRRLRALRRLATEAGKGNIESTNLGTIFLPLVEHFAFDEAEDESGHNLIAEALATIGSLAEWLDWSQFRANFRRYRSYMQSKSEMEKNILRLLGRMSDALSSAMDQKKTTSDEVNGDAAEDVDKMDVSEQTHCRLAKTLPSIEKVSTELTTNFIPFLTNFIHHKQETEMSLRLPASVTTIKLLKILPEQEMAIRLPAVLLDVCSTLKSKAQDSRDTARKTLNDIALLLGPVYFGYILKELRNTLLRGYQLHVLSFTVHSMLVVTTDHFSQGDLDYCMADLVAVVMDDTFGTVGQEKDAEDYVSKMKEVKSNKSYDSMELLAKNATISNLASLVRPLQSLLREKLNSNIVKKLDELMRRIGIGLLRNPLAESREILVFCYEIIKESYQDKAPATAKATARSEREERFLVRLQGGKRGEKRGTTSSHVYKLTRFALDILRAILNKFGSLLTAANLAGFLPVIGDALVQAQEEVKISALRLLSTIIKLPLPEIDNNSHVYLTEAVKMIKESPSTNSEASQASLKLISSVIRERKSTKLREGHLAYLLQRLTADIEEPDRQGVTFNFIRAVMSRKFVVPEMYELVDNIATMMVTNQTRSARDLARGTYIHFLVEYPQAKSRWAKQLGFLAKNLDYKHQEGRQSVLEAIHLLLSKTGDEMAQDIISTFFLPVVLAMANDDSSECREMAGALLGQFYSRADKEQMKTILTPLHSWLEQTDNMALGSIGLQAMRIYFEAEETEKEKEGRFVTSILPDLMQSILNDQENGNWETLYFALQLFTKLCKTNPTLGLSTACTSIWAAVQESLFFTHVWVKTCAANLIGMWLADVAKTHAATGYSEIPLACSSGLVLDKESMLKLLRASLRSLRTPGISEELAMQSVRNLVFLGRCCAQNGLEFQKTEAEAAEEAESEDEDEDEEAGSQVNGEDNKTNGTQSKQSAIRYIFSQISSLLRREVISTRPNVLVPKTASIALLAALIRHLEAEQILPSLPVILLPLQHLTDASIPTPRSSDENFQNTYKALVSNCHEVLDLLQKKFGTTEYIAEMTRVQDQIKERREGRRVKRRIDAVADPERFERDKRRKNERKRVKRHEKGLEHRGKRRGW